MTPECGTKRGRGMKGRVDKSRGMVTSHNLTVNMTSDGCATILKLTPDTQDLVMVTDPSHQIDECVESAATDM